MSKKYQPQAGQRTSAQEFSNNRQPMGNQNFNSNYSDLYQNSQPPINPNGNQQKMENYGPPSYANNQAPNSSFPGNSVPFKSSENKQFGQSKIENYGTASYGNIQAPNSSYSGSSVHSNSGDNNQFGQPTHQSSSFANFTNNPSPQPGNGQPIIGNTNGQLVNVPVQMNQVEYQNFQRQLREGQQPMCTVVLNPVVTQDPSQKSAAQAYNEGFEEGYKRGFSDAQRHQSVDQAFGDKENRNGGFNNSQQQQQTGSAFESNKWSEPQEEKVDYLKSGNSSKGSEQFENKLLNFLSANKEKSLTEKMGQAKFTNQQTQQNKMTSPANSVPEYNILLLGETGTGKSTTINAFANYWRFENLQAAAGASEFVNLVGSKFALTDPKSGKELVIQSGTDENECHEKGGVSSTRGPMAYTFHYGNRLVRLIDTPGMGDTRGMEVDAYNFDQILNYLNAYQNLHAICILLKANDNRQTAAFRYCLTEVLRRLHKSACVNIMFCFTFSRSTDYGTGDGYESVRSYLATEMPQLKVSLEPGENCFFVDNEAFRYLVACKKANFPYTAHHKRAFAESWAKSADQTNAMMEHIFALKPHDLAQTIKLNQTMKIIKALCEPMVRLQGSINANAASLKEEGKILDSAIKVGSNPNAFKRALEYTYKHEEVVPLSKPKLVCTSDKCSKVSRDGQVQYRKCHDNCTEVKFSADGIKGDKLVSNCRMMVGSGSFFSLAKKCKDCDCKPNEHMLVTKEYRVHHLRLVDQAKAGANYNQQQLMQHVDQAITNLKHLLANWQSELSVMLDVSGMLGYIMEKYSNLSVNHFIEPYLDFLLEEEQRKLKAVPNYSDVLLKSLTSLKNTHTQNVSRIRKAISRKELDDMDLSNVKSCTQQLIGLQWSGPVFVQALDALMSSLDELPDSHRERSGFVLR